MLSACDLPPRHSRFRRGITILLLGIVATTSGATELPASLASLNDAQLQLASVHARIVDIESGTTLVSKNADDPVPIASITKLMTAMVVLDSGEPLDEWLTVRERRQPPPNNGYSRIRISSRLQRGELIRISLMASENLAAYTLARQHPGGPDAFVAAMNAKARALGMTDSTFVDPSGLSTENRATAADLIKMVHAARGYDAIREYSRTGTHTARFRDPRYNLRYGNTNPLVQRDAWHVALTKTGYLDAAGRCLVMVANIEGRAIAMVFLDSFGTLSPVGDAGRVREWIETGSGGSVAGPALEYEQRKTAVYAGTDDTG